MNSATDPAEFPIGPSPYNGLVAAAMTFVFAAISFSTLLSGFSIVAVVVGVLCTLCTIGFLVLVLIGVRNQEYVIVTADALHLPAMHGRPAMHIPLASVRAIHAPTAAMERLVILHDGQRSPMTIDERDLVGGGFKRLRDELVSRCGLSLIPTNPA